MCEKSIGGMKEREQGRRGRERLGGRGQKRWLEKVTGVNYFSLLNRAWGYFLHDEGLQQADTGQADLDQQVA